MEDRNSPEAIAIRSNQEDPIVMYLIVRETLGMSVGKTAAQCTHAAQMLIIKYFNSKDCSEYYEKFGAWEEYQDQNYESDTKIIPIFEEWLNNSFRKVVLRADDKEWEKLKQLPNHVVVVDAGLTEIAAGSETVIGFWPMRKSERPKLISKLQVLK